MGESIGLIELLKAVTVDCKDDGKAFMVNDRIAVIRRLLENTAYRPVVSESLAVVYAKRELQEGDRVVLVSSHVDCVYTSCFCNVDGNLLRGTFDNSLGNAAILSLMLAGELSDNVIVAFTGDEEHDSQGAVQVVLALGRMQCNIELAFVLDVTNTGWESSADIALENDLGVDLLTAHRIIGVLNDIGVQYAFKHNAEPDESWDYNDYGIPTLSLCVPVKGDLHSDTGVLVRKETVFNFCKSLFALLK